MTAATAALFADAVLALHAAIVLFVVGGLVYVLAGHPRGWFGARSLRLRLAHLAAIGVVAAQAWLGRLCPLTVLEMWLRRQAGQLTYGESFIAHWLGRLLYWEAPGWVFTAAYTAFGLAVLAAWWWLPPDRRRR
ncbi:MAG: DUF2784 domain-containing protein [Burkholderiales bacterium]|nr:DUF2784 domain-containing protein [Burkholderiales bacterium]MBK8664418.1 DUF2784 domain-containing protein [Burkholderiales bacterium]